MAWYGKQVEALLDETPALDVEGAFRASKTTICLWKEFNALQRQPGIHTILCRWTEDATQGILKPIWRRLLADAGISYDWHGDEQYDEFENGSWAYIRGLKAQDQAGRYSKFRGLTLGRAYIDQAEEIPRDIYLELKARLSQSGYRHQVVISPNAVDEDHWIAREFPDTNMREHHRAISLSVYDNAHNLSEDAIRNLLETYPPGHAKHRSAVLGLRGLNIIGDPVYGPLEPTQPETAAFQRARHERPLACDPDQTLYEAIDYGKHHPCVVWAQYTPFGELHVLGGILGQHLFLEDFVPILLHYRTEWFGNRVAVSTCCDPAGSHANSQGLQQNGVTVLRNLGIPVTYREDSNSPAVRLAMIERLASYMRRRSARGEAFAVDDKRWLRISPQQVVPMRFLADGFEAGYVWDAHLISVGSKQMRRPKKDGLYEHGQNCLEYLEHNFGPGLIPAKVTQTSRRGRGWDPYDNLVRLGHRRGGLRRGGY